MSLRRFKTLMLLLCAACLLLSGWMTYHSLSGLQMAGCGAGSSCDSVMGSRWAWIFGFVPVSLPAAVIYLLLAICTLFLSGEPVQAGSLNRLLLWIMPMFGGSLAGAALWFSWLQAGVLHSFCKYCTALHLLGCIMAITIMVYALKQASARQTWAFFAAGVATAMLFAFVQTRTAPASIYAAGMTDSDLPSFSEDEVPILQDGPDAHDPQDITLLFDFQCIHCRRLHSLLPELIERTGGHYRIFLCPVPLSSACNPYIPATGIDRFAGSCQLTRYAMAVWYANPDAFGQYWDWMLGDGDARARIDLNETERLARSIIGNNFEEAVQNPRIDDYLRKVEELFGRTTKAGQSAVPLLIGGSNWVVPEVDDADGLIQLIHDGLQM